MEIKTKFLDDDTKEVEKLINRKQYKFLIIISLLILTINISFFINETYLKVILFIFISILSIVFSFFVRYISF
jgi:hypothetical protein